MPDDPLSALPTLSELGCSRESLLDALKDPHRLPSLDAARDRPSDPGRFEGENLGYIHDVLECLQEFWGPPEEARTSRRPAPALSALWNVPEPVHNPFRGIGRNDPCPCGSGRKFKKCCMPSQ